MKAKKNSKSMKKYGAKLKILLDQQILTQMIIIKNILKSNLHELHEVIIVPRSVFNDENKQ